MTSSSGTNALKARWAADEPALGAWLKIPSIVTAELVARSGFDYACVDIQHGVVDYQAAVGMLAVLGLGPGTPLARVPWNEPGSIGKSLDAGAHGVIVPMVDTADDARAAVAACHYAPQGRRSYGPTMASMRLDDYHAAADDHVAVIVMIETVAAVAAVDDILAVPGIDAVYVGPADLAVSMGLPPQGNDDEPAFVEALATIVAACRRTGVVPGIHATAALCQRRLDEGFRMITVTDDLVALRSRLADDRDEARAGVTPRRASRR